MSPFNVRLNLISTFALLLAGALLAACGVATAPTAIEQAPALFNAVDSASSCAIDGNPKVLRERCVTVNLDLLEGMQPGGKVLLNFFDDAQYVAVLERSEPSQPDGFIWSGRLDGIEHSQVTLVAGGGILTGNTTLPDELFQVRWVDGSIHAVYQIDQSSYLPEAEPLEPNP